MHEAERADSPDSVIPGGGGGAGVAVPKGSVAQACSGVVEAAASARGVKRAGPTDLANDAPGGKMGRLAST